MYGIGFAAEFRVLAAKSAGSGKGFDLFEEHAIGNHAREGIEIERGDELRFIRIQRVNESRPLQRAARAERHRDFLFPLPLIQAPGIKHARGAKAVGDLRFVRFIGSAFQARFPDAVDVDPLCASEQLADCLANGFGEQSLHAIGL